MHAIALIADLISKKIHDHLNLIHDWIQKDKSVIVVHYGILVLGRYASADVESARSAYPLLKKALTACDGKHVHHVLSGMQVVAGQTAVFNQEILSIAEQYVDHKRAAFKKAARAVVEIIQD